MDPENPKLRLGDEGDDEGGVDVESGEEGVEWIIGDLIMTIQQVGNRVITEKQIRSNHLSVTLNPSSLRMTGM